MQGENIKPEFLVALQQEISSWMILQQKQSVQNLPNFINSGKPKCCSTEINSCLITQTWYFSDECLYCKLRDAAWSQETQLRIYTNIQRYEACIKENYRWQQTIESPGHQHQHHHHSGWGELLQQYLETADQGPAIRCRSCNQNLSWKRNMHNNCSTI